MTATTAKYLVTGASGQLGALAIDALLKKVPASQVVALVRRAEAAAPLEAKGVEVRIGDYTDVDALEKAFAGIDRLLLISSSEVGQRAAQHKNAVDAAKKAGVGFIAYTSILHADTSPLSLAVEHRETGHYLGEVGLADHRRGLGPEFDGKPEAGWILAPRAQGLKGKLLCIWGCCPPRTPRVAGPGRLGGPWATFLNIF